MKNKGLEQQISDEIMMMVNSRKTLMLSTLDENNHPYASYAAFAVGRVSYQIEAEWIQVDSDAWNVGIALLTERHGQRITNLSQLSDFRLFKLKPKGGRYVKGFGKAYQIDGGTLAGKNLEHLRDGHKKREVVVKPSASE